MRAQECPPRQLFMRQIGRSLTMADDGLLRAHRVLICDRDAKWSTAVREVLSEGGIRVVRLLNYYERAA